MMALGERLTEPGELKAGGTICGNALPYFTITLLIVNIGSINPSATVPTTAPMMTTIAGSM